jgi:hypothetical protein
MITCPYCQFHNEDGALFCEQCKSDLGAAEAVVVSQPVEASVPAAEPVHESPPVAAAVDEPAPPVAAIAVEGMAVSEAVAVAESAPVATPVAEATPAPDVLETLAVPSESAVPSNGESVSAPPAAAPAEAEPLPADAKPKLVVIRGQRINAEYPLYEGDNYLGRADEKAVDVDLEDQEPPDRIWSSRQHALITFENGQLAIEDLNSLNGTFVNRLRIHPGQKRPLHVNDVIQIGTVQMRITV